jgi:LysR family transcriptional regulator, chromosome initiation inhibitor
MMLLNHNLRAFMTVARVSTITEAANELGLTQTGVTQRIKSLERDLNLTVFTRSRQGMRLTTAGQSLLRYCQESREIEARFLADTKGEGTEQDANLCIVGPTSFMSGRAADQCKDVFKKWPRLNFRFIIDDSNNRLHYLKTGTADVAVLFPHQVPLEMDSKIIKPDEYVLVGPYSWSNRKLDEILQNERLFAFHPEDQTSLNYLRTFNLLGLLKKPRLFVNENLALKTLIAAGVGFGILSKEISQPFIQRKEMTLLNGGKAMKDQLALAWYPRTSVPNYFREVLRSIK